MKLRWPFQLILLSIVVLCIYFPTLYAEVSLVDDQDAIAGLYNSDSLSIKDIFVPRATDGGYYRPLVGLGYYLDKSLWDLNARAMHLDNIIMHLINVMLVYLLTLVACKDNCAREFHRLLPLLSALLFALHPIATESINWISGRTDPMAANFVLSAAILLIIYRNSRRPVYLVSAMALIVAAMLSKEVSLGMVLAAGIILIAHARVNTTASNRTTEDSSWLGSIRDFLIFYALIIIEVLYVGNFWAAIAGALGYALYLGRPWRSVQSGRSNLVKLAGIAAASSITAILLYTVLRKIAFRSDVSKISQTIKLMLDDTGYSISLFLGASGFYLKKFFFPLPLSFFILEIDPLYDLLGIAVLLFCIILMSRLTLSSALFITGVCMFLPALPFAFGTIAWTGYAERYIYISSAFWIVAIALYLADLNARHVVVGKVCRVAVPALVLFFGWQTLSRNIVWQKNVTILADTVEKSPKSAVIREMYLQALVNAGLYERAREQYTIGTSRAIFSSEGPELILAQILVKEGRPDEAFALYESLLAKSSFKSERALRAAIGLVDRMVEDTADGRDKPLLEKKNLYESLLLKISNDPMLFYNLGQKALGSGDRIAAIGFFERSNSLFAEGSPYKGYSSKIITRLKSETR